MNVTVPGRSCEACSLCCILPDIEELSKPANAVCRNCDTGRGCRIYPDRPSLCAAFHCTWMKDSSMALEWEPARSHMMVYAQGPQITVLVDPAYPDMWKRAPYHGHLFQWAADARPSGGFVIVFVGDTAIKIDPDHRIRY